MKPLSFVAVTVTAVLAFTSAESQTIRYRDTTRIIQYADSMSFTKAARFRSYVQIDSGPVPSAATNGARLYVNGPGDKLFWKSSANINYDLTAGTSLTPTFTTITLDPGGAGSSTTITNSTGQPDLTLNGDIYPSVTNAQDFGSPSAKWQYMYLNGTAFLGDTARGYSHWTIADTMAGTNTGIYDGTTPIRNLFYHGSAANPLTKKGASFGIRRIQNIDSTQETNKANAETNAALSVHNLATSTNYTQPVAIFGLAKTTSTRNFTTGTDALGIQGTGQISGAGTGVAMGGYFEARRDSDLSYAHGVEIRTIDADVAGSAATYITNAASQTVGIWLTASGTSGRNAAAGIQLGNPYGNKFKYGLGFTSNNGSAVDSADIVTDDTSNVAILVRGSHRGGSIIVADSNATRGIGIGTGTRTLSRQLTLLQNNTNTASVSQLSIGQSGSGDASIEFNLVGARAWVFGVDNSDADKIKLSPAGDDFTAAVMQIGTDSSFQFNSRVRGSDAFTTTATSDTVTVTNGAATDYYFVQATGNAAPSANDQLRVEALSGKFVVWRAASGTSGLTYNWFRIK